MNIVDVMILCLIAFGALLGFKRGLTKELATFLGFIIVIVLAFVLKNPLSIILYEHLPFFDFFGIFKGVSILNILLYEVIAFLILLLLFTGILKLILVITGIFEKILSITIILGIPSKIAGMIIGAVEYFVYTFVILFIISLPLFNFDWIQESKLRKDILNHTPVLTDLSKETIQVFHEFADLKEKYQTDTNPNSFNLEALDVFLKYNVVTVESVDKLVQNGKLKIDDIESVLIKYRGV